MKQDTYRTDLLERSLYSTVGEFMTLSEEEWFAALLEGCRFPASCFFASGLDGSSGKYYNFCRF